MYRKRNLTAFLFALVALCLNSSIAQNLNGKKIYVSSSMIVVLKFHSGISKYVFDDKETESLFERRIINDRDLKINSTVENFKTTYLIIDEGQNTHLFLLEYKEELSKNEFVYDFSDLTKLAEEAKKLNENLGKEPAHDPAKGKDETNNKAAENKGEASESPVKKTKANQQENSEVRFLGIISQASREFLLQNYDEAEALYLEALTLKPNDEFCLTKIEQIKNLRNEAESKDRGAEEQKQKDIEYNSHKSQADNAMVSKEYDIARVEYTEALKYKPNDAFVLSQLDKIDVIRNDEKINRYKSYMEAGRQYLDRYLFDEAEEAFRKALNEKQDDLEAKSLLSSIPNEKKAYETKLKEADKNKAFEKRYRDTLQFADDAFSSEIFTTAKDIYKWAISVNKNDPYPKTQIAKIDSIILQRKNESDQRKRDSLNKIKYDAIIVKAEQEVSSKNYNKAIETLKIASELMPSSKYPESRISEIEIIVKQEENAKRAATELKTPHDSLNSITNEKKTYETKLKEADKNKAFEKRYRDTLQFADDAFSSELFIKAKDIYKWAISVNKNDPYPKTQIAKIDSIILQRKNESDQRKRDSLNEIKYDAIIVKAEQEVSSKNYNKAIETLKIAAELMPSSKYPESRISEIETIIKQEEDAKRAATELKRPQDSPDREFAIAMQKCNDAMKNEQYTIARSYVLEALSLRSDDTEAGKMLINIDSILLEMENEGMYYRYVEIGDSLAYTLNDLDGSLKWYDSAKAIKPMEQYAKKQYDIVSAKIFTRDSILLEEQQEKALTEKYNEGISFYKNADNARKEKRYGDAYTGYSEFLSKIDTLLINKYTEGQQYYINHAMEYRKRLEEYKPRIIPVIDIKIKYPEINFSKPPIEQAFGNPVLSNSSKNNDFIKAIISKDGRNMVMVTEGMITLSCRGIYFTDDHVYLKFNIQNKDTAEFLTGAMILELRKSNGDVAKLLPVFISEFPVVFPGEEKSMIYVIKHLIVGNDETIYFNVTDRLNKVRLKLIVPAAVYHKEKIQ